MKDLIYNQRDIPEEQWRYGLRKSADVGCGWIATYNALRLMGYAMEPERLIRMYEKMLPLIHGNLGTNLFAPAVCFRNWGFPVELVFRRERFDEALKQADVGILFYRWKRGLKFGAHFIAVKHTDDGFLGYNTFANSTGPDRLGESLECWIREKKWFGAVLIAISDKRPDMARGKTRD